MIEQHKVTKDASPTHIAQIGLASFFQPYLKPFDDFHHHQSLSLEDSDVLIKNQSPFQETLIGIELFLLPIPFYSVSS